jgi:hypothetical protein
VSSGSASDTTVLDIESLINMAQCLVYPDHTCGEAGHVVR